MSACLLATGHCSCSAQLSGYTPTIIDHGEPYDSLPGRKIVARRRFHVIQNHGMWYMVCGIVNAYINPWPYSWIDDPLPLWKYKPCFDPGTFNMFRLSNALRFYSNLRPSHLRSCYCFAAMRQKGAWKYNRVYRIPRLCFHNQLGIIFGWVVKIGDTPIHGLFEGKHYDRKTIKHLG